MSVPLEPERNLPARYNICPTDTIDVVVERGGKRDLVPMRWGLIPSWWKKSTKEMPATFNARAETVAFKPMFRDALKSCWNCSFRSASSGTRLPVVIAMRAFPVFTQRGGLHPRDPRGA
jgi:hypothetical protein